MKTKVIWKKQDEHFYTKAKDFFIKVEDDGLTCQLYYQGNLIDNFESVDEAKTLVDNYHNL